MQPLDELSQMHNGLLLTWALARDWTLVFLTGRDSALGVLRASASAARAALACDLSIGRALPVCWAGPALGPPPTGAFGRRDGPCAEPHHPAASALDGASPLRLTPPPPFRPLRSARAAADAAAALAAEVADEPDEVVDMVVLRAGIATSLVARARRLRASLPERSGVPCHVQLLAPLQIENLLPGHIQVAVRLVAEARKETRGARPMVGEGEPASAGGAAAADDPPPASAGADVGWPDGWQKLLLPPDGVATVWHVPPPASARVCVRMHGCVWSTPVRVNWAPASGTASELVAMRTAGGGAPLRVLLRQSTADARGCALLISVYASYHVHNESGLHLEFKSVYARAPLPSLNRTHGGAEAASGGSGGAAPGRADAVAGGEGEGIGADGGGAPGGSADEQLGDTAGAEGRPLLLSRQRAMPLGSLLLSARLVTSVAARGRAAEAGGATAASADEGAACGSPTAPSAPGASPPAASTAGGAAAASAVACVRGPWSAPFALDASTGAGSIRLSGFDLAVSVAPAPGRAGEGGLSKAVRLVPRYALRNGCSTDAERGAGEGGGDGVALEARLEGGSLQTHAQLPAGGQLRAFHCADAPGRGSRAQPLLQIRPVARAGAPQLDWSAGFPLDKAGVHAQFCAPSGLAPGQVGWWERGGHLEAHVLPVGGSVEVTIVRAAHASREAPSGRGARAC